MAFLVRHRDGREYELEDAAYFREHYQPDGFAVADPQPSTHAVPDAPDGFAWRQDRERGGKVLARTKAEKAEPPKEPEKTEPAKSEG